MEKKNLKRKQVLEIKKTIKLRRLTNEIPKQKILSRSFDDLISQEINKTISKPLESIKFIRRKSLNRLQKIDFQNN